LWTPGASGGLRLTLVVVGLVLGWLFAAASLVLGLKLFLAYGRVLLRLEKLEAAAPGADASPSEAAGPTLPAGLPAGSMIWDFELPNLQDGRKMRLSQWRGRRVLLVFVHPECSYCRALLPALAALPVDGTEGAPLPVLVSSGGARKSRGMIAEFQLGGPVLLQEEFELGSLYQIGGTPMAYLIGADGRTEHELVGGAEAILALAAPAGRHIGDEPSVEGSRIERNGLRAGTRAPDFRVPALSGGEVELGDYRGRRVLLVFSDPYCSPCSLLAPDLEHIHRTRGDLQVLVVSRGDVEANRAKVRLFGLTFPVALQRQWEVSRLFGMFATPIAYLVDERGVLASDVAVGMDAILALADGDQRSEGQAA
jgi:peroxiredoxin